MTPEQQSYPEQTKSFTNTQLWGIFVSILSACFLGATLLLNVSNAYHKIDDHDRTLTEIVDRVDRHDKEFRTMSERLVRQDEINDRLIETINKLDRTIEKLSATVDKR
ncbi:hypothetical protein [Aeromonas rivipollensis]|uniref:hypothetical protein n=1 Tax=Aeromonas rivipollensis TaxID=948519 RepID=UPI003D243656